MLHKQVREHGFRHLGMLLLVLLILGAAVGAAVWVKSKNDTDLRDGEKQTQEWTRGCTNSNRVSMTQLPMRMSDVASFSPYGLVAGAHVTPIDHLYFYPKAGPRDTYPVYAMADGFITEITVRSVQVDSGKPRPPEYRYMLQHSCQTISYFDLITKVDASIIKEYPDAATKGMRGRFPVKAGQIVGWIGEQSLDTAIYNMSLTLPGFITPAMYDAEPWKIHTDDFFSYFSEVHQAEMQKLNKRKVQPYSGKIDYDQPGKLIGNWFKEGTNGYAGANGYGAGDGTGRGYWSGHLAIFYHAIQPSTVIVSIGEFKDGKPHYFAVAGNTPDPASISKDSSMVKYELIQAPQGDEVMQNTRPLGVALLQVLDGEKLRAEFFPGKTADQVDEFIAPSTYER